MTASDLWTSCIFGDPGVEDARNKGATVLLVDQTPIFAGSCGCVGIPLGQGRYFGEGIWKESAPVGMNVRRRDWKRLQRLRRNEPRFWSVQGHLGLDRYDEWSIANVPDAQSDCDTLLNFTRDLDLLHPGFKSDSSHLNNAGALRENQFSLAVAVGLDRI